MKARKYIYSAVLAGTVLMTMAGCSMSGLTRNDIGTSSAVQESLASQENTPYRKMPVMPDEFKITYEMENGDGTLSMITLAKDSEGNLYYRDSETELRLLTQENGYIQAIPDENGELSAVNTGKILKEQDVQESTAPFWKCVETSEKLIAPGFSLAGTATVAERNCDLYTHTMGISGLNVTYQLYIDQETGICLGWTEEKETGIFDSEASEGTFLCSEFQTESVAIPNT